MSKIIFDQRGVLLIEVLLVVAILAGVLTLIIQSLSASYRALHFTKDYSQARLLLENKLLELTKSQVLSLNYQDEGGFKNPFDKYHYRISSQEVLGKERGGINEATIVVYWPSGRGNQEIKVTTYFLIPQEE